MGRPQLPPAGRFFVDDETTKAFYARFSPGRNERTKEGRQSQGGRAARMLEAEEGAGRKEGPLAAAAA